MTSRRTALKTALKAFFAAPFMLTAAALPAQAAQHKIRIQSMRFSPSTLKIKAGDTVVFENRDSADHTATDEAGAWDTDNLRSGKSATITFSEKGTSKYFCRWHKGMRGKIVVE